jgi:hypothetical protein
MNRTTITLTATALVAALSTPLTTATAQLPRNSRNAPAAAARAAIALSLLRRQQAAANQRQQAALLLAALQARARTASAQKNACSTSAPNLATLRSRVAQTQAAQIQAAATTARQRQAAALLSLLLARASSRAAAPVASLPNTPPIAPFDASGGAQGLINRLNSMSQADVDQLMSRPSILNQFTPSWLKRSGGNALGTSGVPAGLMRDLSRLDNLADPAANARIDKQLRTVQKLGGIAGGMAAEQKVRNSVQKDFYKDLAVKSFEDISRGLSEVEARTGIGR